MCLRVILLCYGVWVPLLQCLFVSDQVNFCLLDFVTLILFGLCLFVCECVFVCVCVCLRFAFST